MIYINDLPDGIIPMCKVCAAEASLFSKVLDINRSVTKINTDIEKISPRVYRKVNGKCSLTLITTNKEMKLFFPIN